MTNYPTPTHINIDFGRLNYTSAADLNDMANANGFRRIAYGNLAQTIMSGRCPGCAKHTTFTAGPVSKHTCDSCGRCYTLGYSHDNAPIIVPSDYVIEHNGNRFEISSAGKIAQVSVDFDNSIADGYVVCIPNAWAHWLNVFKIGRVARFDEKRRVEENEFFSYNDTLIALSILGELKLRHIVSQKTYDLSPVQVRANQTGYLTMN